jgi:Tannase and feruloyl esterase
MEIEKTLSSRGLLRFAVVATGTLLLLLAVLSAIAHDGKAIIAHHGKKNEPIPCAELATRYKAPSVVITSSTEVEATTGTSPIPEHCDVHGTISDNIKFALFLLTDWNGRFQMAGNGGKAGSISISAMTTALQLGYASSSTDAGHDASNRDESGSKFGNDVVFGKEREIDFG